MRNLALMLLSALFFACEDPIGIVIDTPSTGGQINTLFTDTLKVATSTVILDSTFTSGQSSTTIGNYKDPIFGQVTSKTFAQITLPPFESGTFPYFKLPKEEIRTYDSIYVYVVHNGFRYGDTTKNYSLAIHRLTEDFVRAKRYTNEDVLKYNPVPMANATFSYKELKRASASAEDSLLKFKLPTVFGKEIYDLFSRNDSTSNDELVAATKGLAFVPNSNDQNMYGLAVSGSYIRLFYHTTSSSGTTEKKNILLSFSLQRFSQVTGNRNGTVLQNLKKSQSLPSSATNNRTYLQSGTGISPKLTFPTLAALQKISNITINKAELVFEPDLDQINSNFRVPPQVALVQLDANNQIKKTTGNLIEFVTSDGLAAQYVAGYNSAANNYTFNFTSVLQDLVSKKKTTQGISLVPSLLNTTNSTISIYNSDVSRMVIKNIKLNIYYSTKK